MGVLLSFMSDIWIAGPRDTWATAMQAFPPKPTFGVDQMPDLAGRVVLVTGGNGGIGQETCKRLLEHNARVYLAARNKEKADAAIASLKSETGKTATFLQLDLADLSSVKRAAEEFLSKEHELHILLNNAGVMGSSIALTTKDGYDHQWGTNVLGHFYLTKLLMPALLAGVASSPDHHTRVVTTSSSGAYAGQIKFDTLKDGPARRKSAADKLYHQSKLGDAIIARQIARRYAEKGIVSISVNPGIIDSGLFDHLTKFQRKLITTLVAYPVERGALTQLYAGTMPEALNYNGEFLIPWARLGRCKKETYDEELGQRVWQWLEDAVKSYEES